VFLTKDLFSYEMEVKNWKKMGNFSFVLCGFIIRNMKVKEKSDNYGDSKIFLFSSVFYLLFER